MTTLIFECTGGDCWGDKTGDFQTSATTANLWLAGNADIDQNVKTFIPFSGLPFSQGGGSKIITAYITWDATLTRGDEILIRIGYDLNGATPSDWAGLDGRVMSTVRIDLDIETGYVDHNDYTYDITDVIKALVDDPSYSMGQAFGILIHDHGTSLDNRQRIASSSNGSYNKPYLTVTYDSFVPQAIWLT